MPPRTKDGRAAGGFLPLGWVGRSWRAASCNAQEVPAQTRLAPRRWQRGMHSGFGVTPSFLVQDELWRLTIIPVYSLLS